LLDPYFVAHPLYYDKHDAYGINKV